MKHLFFFAWLLLGSMVVMHAQYTHDYVPLKYSSSGTKLSESAFNKKLNIRYHTDDRSMIKKYDHYLYVLHRSYASGSKDKQYIEEPFVKKYLKSILDSISVRNGLKEKFDIVCTRYVVPNAFNMGDYKLYVNIGILEQLKNEAQLAFLLAHELSHQLLFHVQDNFIANEKLSKDKTVKKEIKDIKKAKYNKLDKTFQFVKNYNYDFAKYSRANEKSADSMAVVLISKTDYDLFEGKSLMTILDHSDEDSTRIDYSKYLDDKSKTLKPEWTIATPHTIDFGHKSELEFDKDSIKTHPDIPIRIKMIDTEITRISYVPQGKKKFIQSQAIFDSLSHAAQFEIIETYLRRKRYAAVVYFSIKLLDEYPDNKYLYKNIALGLNELNKAIKKHTIQNYIPIESDDDFSEGYNGLLRIIDRTTDVEFESLVKNYFNRYYSKMSSYPEIQSIYDGFTKK
jgi:hypothetical protein